MSRYILQLDHKHPHAWMYSIRWPGYWAGLGYVANIKDAIKFNTKRQAGAVAMNQFVGLNGLIKIVKV